MTSKKRKRKKSGSKKKKTAGDQRRIFKRIVKILLILALIIISACNWYVHRSREWRERVQTSLGPTFTSIIEYIGDEAADVTDAIGLSGRDVTSPLETFGAGTSTCYAGYPKSTQSSTAGTTILSKHGFIIGYSQNMRAPLWVAYRLHKVSSLYTEERPSNFTSDDAAGVTVRHKDYTNSGFDRGHMAPNSAIASRFGRKAQLETFKTSNIVAQNSTLNRGTWCNLESRVGRGYAQWDEVVWVITGPIFSASPERLPSKVAIPTAFFKIVISEVDSELRAMAFIMPQDTPAGRKPRRYLVSIDDIEETIGFDLLRDLPDELETAIEADSATRLWPIGLQGVRDVLRERFTRKW